MPDLIDMRLDGWDPPLYRHLLRSAEESSIDLYAASPQAQLLYNLLRHLRVLELKRMALNQKHASADPQDARFKPFLTLKVGEFDPLGNAVRVSGQKEFKLPLDTANYGPGSTQSAFYSHLLDVRCKLAYEVDALESIELTAGEDSGDGDEDEVVQNRAAVAREATDGWLLLHDAPDEAYSTSNLYVVQKRQPDPNNNSGVTETGRDRYKVYDEEELLEHFSDLDFVLTRSYTRLPSKDKEADPGRLRYLGQRIRILSKSLEKALEDIAGVSVPTHLALFHHRDDIQARLDHRGQFAAVEEPVRTALSILLRETSADADEARELFASGIVTPEHMDKLFIPGAVIVTSEDKGAVSAWTCASWPELDDPGGSFSLTLKAWQYDGKFKLERHKKWISLPFPRQRIRTCELHPLEHAGEGVKELLEKRARTFWSCRRTAYVAHDAPGQIQRSLGTGNHRFMVDYDTYRELHPDAADLMGERRDDIGEAGMDEEDPPSGGLGLVFPSEIVGFSLQDKKWKTLQVDHIKPIVWNKSAFDKLVLKPTAKELIQAVVSSHISNRSSADVIDGKGKGSLILLHGPPGTGKTLTAESVAEMAQRPLYRVTCGDIGTDPESVETYLESVLYIGKIWGCVVLLDEADVFLEERSLSDLHRNALVSVFLRVLEYYEGILILTSNRVGTFDEAFKSRIKLALHYSTLEYSDRCKIWRNFCKGLSETDPENVDVEDLTDNIRNLAEVELNGRDIRNAISVARDLAQFKGVKMCYGHVKHVIGVGKDFQTYLETTHGYKTDEWLKENGIRA